MIINLLKHLGLLNVGDSGAIYALSQILASQNETELIKFEAAKSLVLLGLLQQKFTLLTE